MIHPVHRRKRTRALCGFVTQLPAGYGTRGVEHRAARQIEMKRRVDLPYHKMLELVTPHFEVDPKVIHDSDVISEGLWRGKVGEPATLSGFRKVNPTACRSHRGHGI